MKNENFDFSGLELPAKCKVKIMMYNDEPRFSYGVVSLIEYVGRLGSLNKACKYMGMAYSKGIRIVRQAEAELGFKLIDPKTGGKNGGGSTLTPEGRTFIAYFRRLEDCVEKFAEEKLRTKDV